jgi:hypothetical protein
LELQVKVLDH